MSDYLNFVIVGFGAGAAYAAIALGLVVTYNGTGIINFAAGAMGAWGCYVYDELRRSGNLLVPLPINHVSTLGADGPYGGVPLVLFTLISGGLFLVLLRFLVISPLRRYAPRGARPVGIVGVVAAAAWTVLVFASLRDDGRYLLPLPPYRYAFDPLGFWPAFLIAGGISAVLGLLVHFLVFRPLRTAPPLAKVVASIGLMMTLQALIVFRFGSVSRTAAAVLPARKISVAGTDVPRDRLLLAVIAVVAALALWAFFRYTRTGLATRGAAENDRAASLARYSPQYLAGTTWVLSSITTSLVLILTLQIVPLSPTVHTFMIVPALACALVGRLKYVGQTVAAALVLGSIQSVFTFVSSKDWWPDELRTGLSDAVPFLVLIVVLFVVGKSLAVRGSLRADPLPQPMIPKNRPWVIAILVVGALVAVLSTHGGYRYGVTTSMMFSITMLSIVVLTGLIGQISLAQAALAGTGGFALSKLSEGAGIGFPWSLILAGLVAAGFGVIVGIPALRIRGAQLAVATLAAAVALERFVFRNASFTKIEGNPIPNAKLPGINFGVREGTIIARWQFGVMVLVILVLVALAVANLMRSSTGRRFIAVRSDERAAAAAGINVAANKLLAFGIASFMAGIAGGLIGYSRGQLSADSFSTFVNVSMLAFAYLGGINAVSGALVGGAFAPLGIGFVLSDRLLDVGSLYTLVAGLGVILTAIFNPIGIAGANRQVWDKLKLRLAQRYGRPAPELTLGIPSPPLKNEEGPVIESTGTAAARHAPHIRTADSEVLLRTSGLSVTYGGVHAVSDVDLEIQAGEIVGLIGPNGAGKTSFVDALTGFAASTGSIEFMATPLQTLPPHGRARRGLARTWQAGHLFNELSVRENLRVAAEPASARSVVLDFLRPCRPIDQANVDWALDLVGLSDHADEHPRSLSIGQQKLLGVARALASRPRLVMLDEPAAGLDSNESQGLGDRLHDVARHGISVFLIDHDMRLVLKTCDYIYVLRFGCLIAEGTPIEIRQNEAVIEAYLGGAGRAEKAAADRLRSLVSP